MEFSASGPLSVQQDPFAVPPESVEGRTAVLSRRAAVCIAPSVLAADFARLGDEARRAEAAGADALHLDIMDGRFVKNLSMGPDIVSAINRSTKLPLHVHLMVERPSDYVDRFVTAGADILS
jgi:ribulose-phosphate 3-epimerase